MEAYDIIGMAKALTRRRQLKKITLWSVNPDHPPEWYLKEVLKQFIVAIPEVRDSRRTWKGHYKLRHLCINSATWDITSEISFHDGGDWKMWEGGYLTTCQKLWYRVAEEDTTSAYDLSWFDKVSGRR